MNVNFETSSFSIMFWITMIWTDIHLHFNYLKSRIKYNHIDSQSWDLIWKPTLNFETLAEKATKPTTMRERRIVIRKTTGSLYNDVDTIFHNESYRGRDNLIRLQRGRLKKKTEYYLQGVSQLVT